MLAGAGETFDERRVLAGQITPVFFGSAVSNFGVQHLLDTFLRHGAPPQPRISSAGPVDPATAPFSGFVFKVQANMNPRHRDCLSFVRVCSGVFERDMTVGDPRTGKPIRLSYAQKLFGQDRESLDLAYPGDIVGLVTHKPFRIGETLTTDPALRYDEIPRFPPEAFAYVRPVGTAKSKQFRDGMAQLLEEGIIQSFRFLESDAPVLLGAVGQLQFDVVVFRLREEYGADPRIEPAPFAAIRWLDPDTPPAALADLFLGSGVRPARDVRGHPVLLFPTEWAIRYFAEKHPKISLHTVSPHEPGFSNASPR
jgi:peptide chain release factor 3